MSKYSNCLNEERKFKVDQLIIPQDSVWDVQFCPYLKPNADPVFAWTGESNVSGIPSLC